LALLSRWRRGNTYDLTHCGNLGQLVRGVGLGNGCRGGVSRDERFGVGGGASGGCGEGLLWEGKARCLVGLKRFSGQGASPPHGSSRPSPQRGSGILLIPSRAANQHGCAQDIDIDAFCALAPLSSLPRTPCWHPPCIFNTPTEASTAREARPIQSALTSISPSQQAQVLWRASGRT